jgi:hypothetical protein
MTRSCAPVHVGDNDNDKDLQGSIPPLTKAYVARQILFRLDRKSKMTANYVGFDYINE